MSSRYAPLAAGLFLLALVPTVFHAYLGYTRPDERRAEAIPAVLAGLPSVRVTDSTWTKAAFSSDDGFEREYRRSSGPAVRLVVIRAYDAKALYHHPELAVAYGKGLVPAGSGVLPGHPRVPVFLLRSEPEVAPGYALFAVHVGGEFMDEPVWFQLRQAAAVLIRGRQRATLFFARTSGRLPETLEGSPAAEVLQAAIRAFLAQANGS
jgi:hypothetical protein